MVLDKIQGENDIQQLEPDELDILAQEIRGFLIEKVSVTGGHLASNLGAVELTMALHMAFHLPEDKLIWDVGHQSYTHKLLTGRRSGFDGLRTYGGMSGFQSVRRVIAMHLIQATVPLPSPQGLALRRPGIYAVKITMLYPLSGMAL